MVATSNIPEEVASMIISHIEVDTLRASTILTPDERILTQVDNNSISPINNIPYISKSFYRAGRSYLMRQLRINIRSLTSEDLQSVFKSLRKSGEGDLVRELGIVLSMHGDKSDEGDLSIQDYSELMLLLPLLTKLALVYPKTINYCQDLTNSPRLFQHLKSFHLQFPQEYDRTYSFNLLENIIATAPLLQDLDISDMVFPPDHEEITTPRTFDCPNLRSLTVSSTSLFGLMRFTNMNVFEPTLNSSPPLPSVLEKLIIRQNTLPDSDLARIALLLQTVLHVGSSLRLLHSPLLEDWPTLSQLLVSCPVLEELFIWTGKDRTGTELFPDNFLTLIPTTLTSLDMLGFNPAWLEHLHANPRPTLKLKVLQLPFTDMSPQTRLLQLPKSLEILICSDGYVQFINQELKLNGRKNLPVGLRQVQYTAPLYPQNGYHDAVLWEKHKISTKEWYPGHMRRNWVSHFHPFDFADFDSNILFRINFS